jgi:type IV secretion system protein VirB6
MVRGVLSAVDCQTRAFAQTGYEALSIGSGTFQIALTGLLTIYIALVGYRMLFAAGGARLSDAPGIALRIGAVLALLSSWATFERVVFNLAADAPSEIAGIVARPLQLGETLAADPVGGLQIAYDQLVQLAATFGKSAGSAALYASPNAAAADALSTAGNVLFMSTAGVVASATLVIGVLTAVGPVFISMFLIRATRGLFAGWVRALCAAAIVQLAAWSIIVLMLSVLEPWLARLLAEEHAGTLDPQHAMSAAWVVYVFGAGQLALVVAALVTAFGFRLKLGPPATDQARSGRNAPVVQGEASVESRAQRLAIALQRDQAAERLRVDRLAMAGAPRTLGHALSARPDGPGQRYDYRRPKVMTRRSGSPT